jgi:signal transduction histidine kinase/CheY-like chemotaxis protein
VKGLLRPRGTLFRKYAVYFTALVATVLLASGIVGLYFAYSDARALVDELQREKVRSATLRIEQFARTIEDQLRALLLSVELGAAASVDDRHVELLRLLQQASAVMDLVWLDPSGRQLVKVSRVERDEVGPGRDWSAGPAVNGARDGRLYASAVYFRSESEPYTTLAVGAGSAGTIVAEVNLKLVWGIVAAIGLGPAGAAYVVDSAGRLIAHPDISLVLRKTDLSRLPQVNAAIAGERSSIDVTIARVAADGADRAVLTAGAPIPTLGWHVFVEQPLVEVFRPLYASVARTGFLLVAGVAVAVAAALTLARRMTAPIEALKERATRLGEGRWDGAVDVATGDELQALASAFDRMVDRLRQSHEGMEATIAARTGQLAEANRAKSRFLAAASHDLRQPVHALGLFLAQAREARSPAERDRLLAKIEASSQALSELVDALLDVSKLDAGAVTPRPCEFAVQAVLDRVEQDFALAAQAKGLRLRVRPSALRAVTDPVLMERILINLVGNAVRYTHNGGVLVACRRRGAKARLEVWDTGVGIPADQRERIFEEFYQGRPAAGDTAPGLGLGLAIVRRLAELLHVTVDLRSREGRGSVFAIEVPVSVGVPSAPRIPELSPSMGFEGARALVVDDDRAAREAITGLLEHWGWQVVSVGDGESACAALPYLPAPPDVVISDYHLSGGESGIELVQRLRTACGSEIPAVLVSADVTEELHGAAKRAGLIVLHKPLQAAKLRTLLHHLRTLVEAAPSSEQLRVGHAPGEQIVGAEP